MTISSPIEPDRSSGVTYQELLDQDTRSIPEVLRSCSPLSSEEQTVGVERYFSPEFHQLEMERVWKRAWQMACREEEIPEVGDHTVYDIGLMSILVVRSAVDRIQAFHNVCLHRGRRLRDFEGRSAEIRCPFHGWTWQLDGSLAEVPCRWDFPSVHRDDYHLPELRVGLWGGFVFVNMEADAEPLESYLGALPEHFERWPLEKRYKESHVAKVLDCNWKIAQEAFMEAYHVITTHPQLLAGIGDANSQYDCWENFSRAITPNMTPSPHVVDATSEQDMLDSATGRSLDSAAAVEVAEGKTARSTLAQLSRMRLQATVPDTAELSDAEMVDSFYYTLFPNFHPWGAYNRICYRFRPLGDNPRRSIMEVMYLAPFRGKRPPPAPVHWLGEDEDWTHAPELGLLARVFNQDTINLPQVQRGVESSATGRVTLARYQESKLRHFHQLLDRWVAT
ncbi:MAG: aromatic ring-hydroxylating dioxygenase subunit alpha [Acidobacteriota bacterium]|nr:aromatic ring-hydroxylating dioxygenase subunit alpha [Acidobacteriota bacterium]